MKKFKKVISIVSSFVLATASMLPVSAIADLTTYDIQNEAYIERIDSYYGKLICQEELKEYFKIVRGEWGGQKLVNIYSVDAVNGDDVIPVDENGECILPFTRAVLEYEHADGGRSFINLSFMWYNFEYHGTDAKNEAEFYKEYHDEVNAFLRENNYKAQFVKYDDKDFYYIKHEAGITMEEVIMTAMALFNEYGLYTEYIALATTDTNVYYDESIEETEPTTTEPTEPTATVPTEPTESTTTVTTTVPTEPAESTTEPTTSTKPVGDVNGDDKIDARDCSFIAVKIASGESESLPDSADFNGDKKVNVRDAAAIANFLAEK